MITHTANLPQRHSAVFVNFLGLVKDEDKTLLDLKITGSAKIMVVGSTLKDVETIKTTTSQQVQMESRKEGILLLMQ